jgi:ribonucleoside-triphosphate reductase
MSPTYSVCKNHGYISGEVYTCPECGEKTEVYSRITGYYRPVQNWNDGKTQEYKDRAVYNIETSKLKKNGVVVEEKAEEKRECDSDNGIYLFKTATCPNCKIAMTFLDKAGVKYEQILATAENKALVDKYGINQAPTLVVVENGEVSKYKGVSDIKKYLGV